MKNLYIITLFSCIQVQAQSDLGKTIGLLTKSWDEKAVELESYEGLKSYCENDESKLVVRDLLNEINHFDSLLYDRVVQLAEEQGPSSEMRKTLRDIQKLQVGYRTPEFMAFLAAECQKQAGLESDHTPSEQDILALENELSKFIDRITERIDLIEVHVEHLHIK